jgi:hypothetical protein
MFTIMIKKKKKFGTIGIAKYLQKSVRNLCSITGEPDIEPGPI